MPRAKDGRHVIPQISFNAGEVSPYLRGRIDLQKFQHGCAEMTNFVILPQGPITRRAGTVFQSTLPANPGDPISEEEPEVPTPQYDFAFADPWNFKLIDTSEVGITDEEAAQLWWSGDGTTFSSDDSQIYGAHEMWMGPAFSTYGINSGQIQSGTVDTNKYMTFDLGEVLWVDKVVQRKGTMVDSNEHWLRKFKIYYAQTRPDPTTDFDDSTMVWTEGEEFDLEALDAFSGVGTGDLAQFIAEFATPVQARYIKIVQTDHWTSPSTTSYYFDKITFSVAPVTATQNTVRLTQPRNLVSKKFMSPGNPGWTVTCPEYDAVSGSGWLGPPVNVADTSFNTYLRPASATAGLTLEIENLGGGTDIELSRILWYGHPTYPDELPSYFLIYGKTPSNPVWTLLDQGNWSNNIQSRYPVCLTTYSSSAKPVIHIQLPQQTYSGIKLECSGPPSGYIYCAEIRLVNEYLTSSGDPNSGVADRHGTEFIFA